VQNLARNPAFPAQTAKSRELFPRFPATVNSNLPKIVKKQDIERPAEIGQYFDCRVGPTVIF
jgi:hypothetical protein